MAVAVRLGYVDETGCFFLLTCSSMMSLHVAGLADRPRPLQRWTHAVCNRGGRSRSSLIDVDADKRRGGAVTGLHQLSHYVTLINLMTAATGGAAFCASSGLGSIQRANQSSPRDQILTAHIGDALAHVRKCGLVAFGIFDVDNGYQVGRRLHLRVQSLHNAPTSDDASS